MPVRLASEEHGGTDDTEARRRWVKPGEKPRDGGCSWPEMVREEREMRRGDLPEDLNRLTGKILDAAVKVRWTLGPGLLESVDRGCLAHELRKAGLRVETEVPQPLVYDGLTFERAYRLDLLVEGRVVVEVKAMPEIAEVHLAQVLTYLTLGSHRVGLLLNFGARSFANGIRRVVR